MGWRSFFRLPETPLLIKELSELANRRRTYIFRFVYATLLFAAGLVILFSRGGQRGDMMPNVGRELFLQLVFIQQVAILLLVPSMAASALTQEKERETLALLLLTTISPYEIVLQKFLSRVVTALSYVMLSFPLLAVAYAYGGVPMVMLGATCAILVVTVIYHAAFSIMCSSYFRTTVEALIAVYVLQAPISLIAHGYVPSLVVDANGGPAVQSIPAMISFVCVSLFLSLIYLVMATEVLHRRAFVPPRNVLLQLFQALDRIFNEWNTVTGGVVLIRDGDPLPVDRPVAWRETAKKSLGTFRYLVRVLVVIEVPILFVSQLVNIDMIRGHHAMTVLYYTLWVASAAMLALHAGNVIAAERSRQTLDVLLATPLSGEELVLQKLAGVRRLLMVLLIPFVTIILFENWFRDYGWLFDENGFELWYLAESLLVVLALGKFAMWLVFWIGLKTRSTLSAVFLSLGALAAICLVPQFLSMAAPTFTSGRATRIVTAILAMNPATLVQLVEAIPTDDFRARHGLTPELFPWMFGAAIVGYFVLGVAIRKICLRNADRLLGRSWGEGVDDSAEVASAGLDADALRRLEHPGQLAAGVAGG
ncbi:ABC-2 family transporter protein [Caulifigura coniformis]|uniref:ABC-2 family transporter protein n=1 Tax=Caulifigura coniformis TaxID=2527983 RepID=A0A517SLB4_9PLAN|nr:ABC transporter permease subunit [Caulifigura coniformis]QDT56913.1 ABC-2 family transporter protein [Caulifigura coniformis]